MVGVAGECPRFRGEICAADARAAPGAGGDCFRGHKRKCIIARRFRMEQGHESLSQVRRPVGGRVGAAGGKGDLRAVFSNT